ncbi:MAG: ABC transporter ATP-binding protein/permease [Oscillospiraceae bacterium]|nr:ABC transporter ATP-binding protein/permease [Oscillospiraceae bacterium]
MAKKNKTKEADKLHTEHGIFSNIKFVLGRIKRYRPVLFPIMLICVVAGSVMSYLWSFFGKFVIDIIETQALTPEKDIQPLINLLVWVGIILLTLGSLNSLGANRFGYIAIDIRMRVITERIRKTLKMDYQSLEKPEMLDMLQKAENSCNDNNNGFEGMIHNIRNLLTSLLTIAVAVTGVAVLDLRLVVALTVICILQFLFFNHIIKRDKKEVWDVLAPSWRKIDYMEQTTQNFDYAKDIRLFEMKGWLSGKQYSILRDKENKVMHSKNLWICNNIFNGTLSIISNGLIYAALIYSVLKSDMSIGNFTLFMGLATAFSSNLTFLLNKIGNMKKCSMQIDDLRTFLDYDEGERNDYIPLPNTDKYIFEFKNVSFKYDGAEDYALKNLNLTLEAGKRLAVVGLNGAGKTTFIKLLLRLYDVTDGEILMNGVNVKLYNKTEYYTLFAPVFQNVEVFAFPMSENISMKSPEKTDAGLSESCARKAGLSEKLDSLTDGISTELLKVLHDDGVDLSGGEKQKLALARALYKNAPVIVLDEPTAALDPLAEYNLYKSFDEIISDKSAVYISHRLSSTRFCDRIAMFKSGEMVEYGTHDELLSKGGDYAEMFEIQAQYYKDKEEVST